MSIADAPRPAPARDYREACERFAELARRDGPQISSAGRSRFFAHGERTPHAIVFVHGFTNCPQQWEWFGSQMHARGATVVIPRLPGHGHFFRTTHALGRPAAAEILDAVSVAVDVACGAAEAVMVVGLSIGGTIAPWFAQRRADVARAIGLVPFFAPRNVDRDGARRLARVLLALPGAFVLWDPGGDGSQIPSYGYPSFSTHMLAQCLRIAEDVAATAERNAPCGAITFALNAHEPACNNAVALAARDAIERARPDATRLVVWDDLPDNHDIVDPTNPRRRVDLVYPRLRALIDSGW